MTGLLLLWILALSISVMLKVEPERFGDVVAPIIFFSAVVSFAGLVAWVVTR